MAIELSTFHPKWRLDGLSLSLHCLYFKTALYILTSLHRNDPWVNPYQSFFKPFLLVLLIGQESTNEFQK